MDIQQTLKDVEAFCSQLSQQFGTGSVTVDLVTLMIVFAILASILIILSIKRGSTAVLDRQFGSDRVVAIAGKIEKIEMNVNDLRTEVIRSLEIVKGDMNFLRDELSEIRRLIGGEDVPDDESGSGGAGFGSDSEGGGGRGGSGGTLFAPPVEAEPLEVAEAIVAPVEEQPVALSTKLTKTRSGFFQRLRELFVGKPSLDGETVDELEALLVASDLGVKMTSRLIEKLRAGLKAGEAVTQEILIARIREMILEILNKGAASYVKYDECPRRLSDGPRVVMLVGVNGVGKTTTVAKLASRWRSQGAKVMVAAADTFRAAAVDQLVEWGKRVQVPVISGAPEAKPATVVFDAMVAAKDQEIDVLIIDTAGRLHTKSNLMQELSGVRNAVTRHQASAPHETLLVVDGSTGQNAIQQAREFNAAVPLTGIVVTKLDGTPKGGVVVAITDELGVPVTYIGVGEAPEDLRRFNPDEFADALLDASGLEMAEKVSAHAVVRRRRRVEDPGTTLSVL